MADLPDDLKGIEPHHKKIRLEKKSDKKMEKEQTELKLAWSKEFHNTELMCKTALLLNFNAPMMEETALFAQYGADAKITFAEILADELLLPPSQM